MSNNVKKSTKRKEQVTHYTVTEEIIMLLAERQVSVGDARTILAHATDRLSVVLANAPVALLVGVGSK
jgi:hypothetical protein